MSIKSVLFCKLSDGCHIELLRSPALKHPAKHVAVELNNVARRCTFWIAANSVKCLPCLVAQALGGRDQNVITATEFSRRQRLVFPRESIPSNDILFLLFES